jgi:hypothetical protein
VGGLVCVLLYTLSQWREIGAVFPRRQARYGTLAATSVLVVLGILVAINYIGARQNKRWDLTAASSSACRIRAATCSPSSTRRCRSGLRAGAGVPRYRDKLKEYEYVSKNVTTEYIDPDKKPTLAKQNQIQQYGTIVFNYKGRSERVTSDSEQDLTNGVIKVVSGQQRKVYFTQGHGEKDTTSAEPNGYNAIAAALGRENYTVDRLAIAQQGSVPGRCRDGDRRRAADRFLPPEIDALRNISTRRASCCSRSIRPDKPDSPPVTNLIALAHDWGVDLGNNVVVDVSGMGRMIGTDASVPVVATYPSHAITARFQLPHRLSDGARDGGGGRRRERTRRAAVHRNERAQLGGGRHQEPAHDRQVALDEAKGDKKGPISPRRRGRGAGAAPRPATPPKPGDDAPKPETAGGRDRRLGFRGERRARHPGQPRSLHEHPRLAVAAGEPDLDPAQGARRSPHHADGDAAGQHHVAVAAAHPGLRVRHGRLHLVAEAVNARPAINDCAHRRSCRARRVHLLRHVETA